jgi:hypothetical protein
MKREIIYLILAVSFLSSCQKILFKGEEETRLIVFAEFHAVKISGIYNIILIQDSTNKLVIKGKNDINTINAVVSRDTLVITNSNKLSYNIEKSTLELHFSDINYIVTYSPVSISNQDTIRTEKLEYGALGEIAEVSLAVNCNSLQVVTSANTLGYLTFYGKANTATFWARYGCSFFAGNLTCGKAEIINYSIGDIYVYASDELKAFIRGKGNIYYYGNPKIDLVEKKGSGNLIRVYN